MGARWRNGSRLVLLAANWVDERDAVAMDRVEHFTGRVLTRQQRIRIVYRCR